MPSDLDRMLALLAGQPLPEAAPEPPAQAQVEPEQQKPRRGPQRAQEHAPKATQAEIAAQTPKPAVGDSRGAERSTAYEGCGVSPEADAERVALGLKPLQFPDWEPAQRGRRSPRVEDVPRQPEPSSPTPTEAVQQELPTGGPSSDTEPTPGTPKRKREAAAKPAKPVTPSPFRDLPAPEPVEVALVSTERGLADLVARWCQKPPVRIGLDTETTGLSPLLGARIRLVQLMADTEAAVYVVDTWAVGDAWARVLQPLVELPATELVAHNAAFEAEHLAAAGLRIRSPLRCTLLAAWLLSRGVLPTAQRVNAKGSGLDLASCCGRVLGLDVSKAEQVSDWAAAELSASQLQYAALDARLALDLWAAQRKLLAGSGMVRVHQVESEALVGVAEARLTGLTLDLPEARRLLHQREGELEQLQERLLQDLGVENLNSTRQVAEAVVGRGHDLPPTKAGNLKVSEDVLRPLYQQDQGLVPIKEARATGKDLRTYLRNWVELAGADPAGRLRPQLRGNGATTGRMTCPKGELPKPTTLQGVPTAMRHLFVAAPGHVLVDGDWSAIEHRLAAALYGEDAYVRIYTEGLDPHAYTAAAIYGRELVKDAEGNWPPERSVGKTANFAMGYGCGPRKMQDLLSTAQGREVSLVEATRVCDGWDRAYPALAKLRNQYRQREPWEVKSALGRRMADKRLTKGEPGVHFSGSDACRIRSTNALNWPIQSSGAELLKEAVALLMPRLWDELPGARLAHLVHDEILLEVPEHLAEQAAAVLLEVMQDPGLESRYLKGVLPLVAQVKVGRTWAETH
jgi:DNA polymerase-1